MTVSIRVDELSKRYRRSAGVRRGGTLKEAVARLLRAPFRRSELDPRDTFWAVREVSFEVRPGEVVGLLGHNGAGKSTLLRLLARITEPTSGKGELFGRTSCLLEIGTGFHLELTGRENIYLTGSILGMRHQEVASRFDSIVEFSEVGAFLDTPVKHYSSGMYLRLGFAINAHLEPDILLVDEVLAVGDLPFKRRCLDKIRGLCEEGASVVFVSHDLSILASVCSRMLLLERGRLIEDGPTESVLSSYCNGSQARHGELIWADPERPTSDSARLFAVRALDLEGAVRGAFDGRLGFRLEVEYGVLRADPALVPSFQLVNSRDECVVSANDLVEVSPAMLGSRLISRVTVPPGFLAAGSYSVDVGVMSLRTQELAESKQALTLHVVDPEAGLSPGMVRPRLEWTTHSLDGSREVRRCDS